MPRSHPETWAPRLLLLVAHLEKQLERKLQFTRVVDLRGDHSGRAVSKRRIWRAKLGMVKEIECLGTELQRDSFKERSILDCGKVHVHQPRGAKSSQGARRISISKRRRGTEVICVEVLLQPVFDGRAGNGV